MNAQWPKTQLDLANNKEIKFLREDNRILYKIHLRVDKGGNDILELANT